MTFEPIQFFVTYNNNKTNVITLDSSIRVEELFCKISSDSAVPCNKFYLVCNGKIILDQEKTLIDSGVRNNSTILMLIKNNILYEADTANYQAYLEYCNASQIIY